MKNYDLIVIGAGSGGLNIASFMNKVGFKVLLVDKTDKNIGGDCLNFGCVPSKALIHVSKLVFLSKTASEFGIKVQGQVDMQKVKNYIYQKIEFIRSHENASFFRKAGIDVALGDAKFISKNSIQVTTEKNKNEYSAKNIIIATGSKPRKLEIKGGNKVKFLTNENIFELNKLPKRLIIIGGGPIGLELGQAFNRLGSKVTILIRSDKFLPKESKEITDILLKELKKEGINFMFTTSPKEFLSPKELLVENNGKKEKLQFDNILLSIGRELNFKKLDLEKANIAYNEKGIIRDNYLRTTNKNILLCGDIVGSYMFTHAAELHASIIINNFFSPFKKKFNSDKFSWVTFTSPEIATFGLNEKELKKRRITYEKLILPFSHDDRAIVDSATKGKLIIFISKKRIVGGSMIGKNAGEVSSELILAMSNNLKTKVFLNKIYPYPTASRVNKTIIGNHAMKNVSNLSKRLLKFLY